ncbi:carboxylesterase-like protein [Dendryphion nanum]|uniref:Carboxylesterase-like protein n=1 Tax=Dendryphion nanum TaxID=256645 RepID=A0A9P9EI09_9PLEO|nr:carboxylesterase-like protein [Dendryphion nanum]
MATTLKTSFGEFRGKAGDGVVQYLGVKYANLKDRLAAPTEIEQYGSEVVDATQFGPRVISAESCEFEQSILIQQKIDTPKAPPMSGLDCLNLNITVPVNSSDKPLPVMVFIHGGGFIIGSNWWPHYDPALLVKHSVQNGTPIIAINISYRLAVLGGLTSEELRNAGYAGNNSLRDQRCALKWIKNHIAGFGGDPDNVTASGESAGAASVLMHLFSKEPLFKRAISMSGTPTFLRPLPLKATELAYQTMMKQLGLENASVEQRIEHLLTVDPDELVSKTPMMLPFMPFIDGDIMPEALSFSKAGQFEEILPGTKWCTELTIGDCQHDGTVFGYMGLLDRKSGIASALTTSFTKNLPSLGAAEAILQAYNISSSTSDDDALQSIYNLVTDICYYLPAQTFAESFPGKSFYFQFNELNPWDGLFKGHSTHMLDAAFVFQNYNDKLEGEARQVAITLANDFIKFINGVAPWKEYEKSTGVAKTFGPSTSSVSGLVEQNGWGNARRDVLFRLKEEGKIDFDELHAAWNLFLAGN